MSTTKENEKAPLLSGGLDEGEGDSAHSGALRSALRRRDQSQEPTGRAGELARDDEGVLDGESASDQLVLVTLLHVLLLMVAVVFSQSLSAYMFVDKDRSAAQLTLIVLMTIGIGVVLGLYCRNDVAVAASRSTARRSVREKLKHILRNYLPVVGMLFFYPFSCALDLFNVVVEGGCNEVFKHCGRQIHRKHIVEIVFHVVRPIFMGAELFLCLQFHRNDFRRQTGVRTGLVFIMAVNIGLWFISLLYETDYKYKGHMGANATSPCNWSLISNEDRKNCLQGTKEASKRGNVNLFLYPFAIEFTLLFGEFIADKLFSCKPSKAGPKEPRRKTARRVQPPPPRPELDGTLSIGDQSVEVPLRSFFSGSTLILAVGVIVNVAYCVLGYLSYDSSLFGNFDVHEVFYSFSIVYWCLLTFLSLVGFVCSRSFVYRNEVMRGIDYMVLLTGLGPMLLDIVTLTGCLKGNRSAEVRSPIVIACHMTSVVQLTVQVPFMFYCDRVKPREADQSDPRMQRLESVFKAIVLYQALCNGATWVVMSVLSAGTGTLKLSQIFIEIVSPFAIFFRFNSLLLFLRAYLGE